MRSVVIVDTGSILGEETLFAKFAITALVRLRERVDLVAVTESQRQEAWTDARDILRGEGVCDTSPYRRHEHGGRRNRSQAEQVHVAQAAGWQPGVL